MGGRRGEERERERGGRGGGRGEEAGRRRMEEGRDREGEKQTERQTMTDKAGQTKSVLPRVIDMHKKPLHPILIFLRANLIPSTAPSQKNRKADGRTGSMIT